MMFEHSPSICVCCGDVIETSQRLRCPPCEAATDALPLGWSLMRSARDGRWYPLRHGRYQLVDLRGTRASFDTSARCVAYAVAAQREYEAMWKREREQAWEYGGSGNSGGNVPPGSGGAA